MISERTFSRSFSGFWFELLPLLTPSYIHIINEGFKVRLTDEYGVQIESIPKNPLTRDPAVVAEFAFYLAQHAIREGISIKQAFLNKNLKELI